MRGPPPTQRPPPGPPGPLFSAAVFAASFVGGLGLAGTILLGWFLRRDPDYPSVLGLPVLAFVVGLAALGLLGGLGGWRRVGAAYDGEPASILPHGRTPLGREPPWLRALAVPVALGAMVGGVWIVLFHGGIYPLGIYLAAMGLLLALSAWVARVRARSRRRKGAGR